MQSVLVVEDEAKIRQLLRSLLERDGLEVVSTASGAEALTLAATTHPDLVLLDLRLPDVSGEEVAREIRTSSDVPIVMLTAKAEEEERIRGLELGADDYVTKPFSPRELLLRIRAVLRRASGVSVDGGPASYGDGVLVLDEDRREAVVRGAVADLTPTEWALLIAIAHVPGRVYSRFELINRVHGYEVEGFERTIDSHIRNLRRKVEVDPHHPEIVETVLGAGYRLGVTRDA
jgi:DNA-binding response OmpR family regulator